MTDESGEREKREKNRKNERRKRERVRETEMEGFYLAGSLRPENDSKGCVWSSGRSLDSITCLSFLCGVCMFPCVTETFLLLLSPPDTSPAYGPKTQGQALGVPRLRPKDQGQLQVFPRLRPRHRDRLQVFPRLRPKDQGQAPGVPRYGPKTQGQAPGVPRLRSQSLFVRDILCLLTFLSDKVKEEPRRRGDKDTRRQGH
ncbi:hypothetical protein WMY93_033950 [Mugilogobius chulae]|uniref:Uncharacterized protein n=1 Tax=Mugilogobius chulae TaxID=88201 RepID=A0AAW0MLT5_9GOBI